MTFKRIMPYINVILTIICLMSSIGVITRVMNPEQPILKVYKTNLQEIKFPISFRICLHESRKILSERYKKLGYENVNAFFGGVSKFNNSLVGWAGHTKDGGTIFSTVDGQDSFVKSICN